MTHRGFLLLLLVGCREPDPPAAPAPGATSARTTASTPAPEPAGDCASLPRTTCMQRLDCTLEAGPTKPNYVCRKSRPPCEDGIRQADLEGKDIALSKRTQEACAARPGCAYVPGHCYCHCRGVGQTSVPDGDEAPDCDCDCGGGAPPMCAARDSKEPR